MSTRETCLKGHPYTDGSFYMTNRGKSRRCKRCTSERRIEDRRVARLARGPIVYKRNKRAWTDAEVYAWLAERTEYVTESGCRIWLGPVTIGETGWGYGLGPLGLKRRFGTNYTHRVAYMVAKGPVPEGMELDHRCNVRACCNIEHLRPMTHRDNVARGLSPIAANQAKTHCARAGHPLFGDNVAIRQERGRLPFRVCKRCRADKEGARRKRLLAAGWKRVGDKYVPPEALSCG